VASSRSRLFPWRRSLRRDLIISTVDAVAYCVMVGSGEMYLGAFVLALGLGPLVAGPGPRRWRSVMSAASGPGW